MSPEEITKITSDIVNYMEKNHKGKSLTKACALKAAAEIFETSFQAQNQIMMFEAAIKKNFAGN